MSKQGCIYNFFGIVGNRSKSHQNTFSLYGLYLKCPCNRLLYNNVWTYAHIVFVYNQEKVKHLWPRTKMIHDKIISRREALKVCIWSRTCTVNKKSIDENQIGNYCLLVSRDYWVCTCMTHVSVFLCVFNFIAWKL